MALKLLKFYPNIERIQTPIFNTITNIICYTEDAYEKKLIKLKPFFLGLDIISSENSPIELKVAAGWCIFYGVNYIDSVQKEFIDNELIYKTLLEVFENSQTAVKAEACCIIISIITNCPDQKRLNYISNDLILSFLNFLNGYDEDQLLKILRLFVTLFTQYYDEMADILSNTEAMETFAQLSSHENSEVADLSNILMNLISEPPNIMENDN